METTVKYSRIILFVTGLILVCACLFNVSGIYYNGSIKILICLIFDIIIFYLYLVLDLVYVKAYNGKKNTVIKYIVIGLFVLSLYCTYILINNPRCFKFNICYYFNNYF
ncbi:MAG: hypothetical protein ACERKV_12485 [Clostridiaceae bacterium]